MDFALLLGSSKGGVAIGSPELDLETSREHSGSVDELERRYGFSRFPAAEKLMPERAPKHRFWTTFG